MKKLLLATILLLALCYTTAQAAPIYTYKEEIPVSDSITLTNVSEFHSSHNISYSYIKADLSDQSTSLKLLKSPSGIDTLETMETLTSTDSDIVAALNADFFSVFKGTQGFSLGIEVSNGELYQSPINPETMATVFSDDNGVSMGYIQFLVAAVAPNGEYSIIRHINKPTTYYGDVLMYTKDFNGGKSPAPGENVVEVVVEDNTIKEFRRQMPPAEIPENGCVLVVSEGSSMFFANNFNVGDPIKFDYYVTPDLSEIQTAFGGGGMLVNDGQVLTTFSHVISGNQPRSAIGVDRSGKILYLVAVDGRQDLSRGMSMQELANLMHSLGCYQAVNLDGGGSTRMVASTIQNANLLPVNSPTENRRVINAVGLAYDKKPGTPSGLQIKTSADTIYLGEKVEISAAVYDENMRPVNQQASFSSDHGTISGNWFIPDRGGNVTIKATCGKASATANIFVVSKVAGIDIPDHLTLDINESKTFDVNIFDKDGHYVKVSDLSTFEIKSSDPSVASVNGNTITGHKDGTTIISVKQNSKLTSLTAESATAYISVAVGGSKIKYSDGFESPSGTFKAYPDTSGGSFGLSEEEAQSGSKSGKLTFDFTNEDDTTKGAYFALNQKVILHSDADKIQIGMYTPTPLEHQVRAQFTDADGKIAISSFGTDFEPRKWNILTAPIPKDAKLPLKLDRIYVLYVSGEPKDTGFIYLDNLTFDSVADIAHSAAPANSYDIYTVTEKNDFTVGVLQKDTNTLFAQLANKKIKELSKNNPYYVILDEIQGFSTKEDKNALYIYLDTSKGGIRSTDATQWDKMASAIGETTKNNIFLLSKDPILGGSEYENQVLCDFLADTAKNVFVVYGGTANAYKNINGINFFSINHGFNEKTDLTRISNISVLEFSFGKETTFNRKTIY